MRTLCRTMLLALLLGPVAAAERPPGAAGGRVVDDTTGRPVPFVSVGVPGIGVGTVGDEDGRFVLTGAPESATVMVSAIGYAPLGLPVADLATRPEVRLRPVEIRFRETVAVAADPAGPPRVFGTKLEPRGYGVGYGSALLGAEMGSLIRIDRPTFVESAHFVVAHPGDERSLYRVNVYDFADGEVGANLLDANVLVAGPRERGTIAVDLREHGLVVRDDVLLALEWVRADADAGNANVMFRARPRSSATLYLKPTSQMPFTRVKRHRAGFYLLGHPLDSTRP